MRFSGWIGVALGLTACGGGGAPPPVTVGILGTASLDGEVRSDGVAVSAGGSPAVGDVDSVANGLAGRQFFSFDLTGIPAGAAVLSATLHLHQTFVLGFPYVTLGDVVADHLDYGPSLDAGDFALAALTPAYATVSLDGTSGLRTLDATAAVQADRAASRVRTQFRLRFDGLDSDLDGAADAAQFADRELSTQNATAGQQPVLFVLYQP